LRAGITTACCWTTDAHWSSARDGIYDKTRGAELRDPASDTWKATGPVVTTRFEPAFAKMPDGRVLVAGGWNGDQPASAEICDPAADTWTAVAPMSETRGNPEAATLSDGRVLVAGGHGFEDLHPTVSRTAEIYDPATGTWAQSSRMRQGRSGRGQAVHAQ
jgi:Kelch motif protein